MNHSNWYWTQIKLTPATLMKKCNCQRKLAYTWTMELGFQCTCKIPPYDVCPSVCLSCMAHGWHSRGKQWFLVRHAFLSLSAHMNTHLDKNTHTDTHRHTPPARPPGLDDPLNSSNYQALTDRQIRSEQGCWGLHRQTDRQTKRQTDGHRQKKMVKTAIWLPQTATEKRDGRDGEFAREFCH